MLGALTLLLVYQLIGETITFGFGLPIPGPVIGMALFLLDALRIPSHAVRGFALGLPAHGQGVARAFVVSEEMGAFAGLAMGLSALVSALVSALLLPWFARWLLQVL